MLPARGCIADLKFPAIFLQHSQDYFLDKVSGVGKYKCVERQMPNNSG
jgi:hypothetical protein